MSVIEVIIIHLQYPFPFFLLVLIRWFPAVQYLLLSCAIGESRPKQNTTI